MPKGYGVHAELAADRPGWYIAGVPFQISRICLDRHVC
jgi:hypothetical protein